MDYDFMMTGKEKADLSMQVDRFNRTLEQKKKPNEAMGKDEFLKILITQLSYQDPMAPMEDKEFISQMAQFSALEQMTNMSEGFTKLREDFSQITSLLSGRDAVGALGRPVEIFDGEKIIQGTVRAVTRNGTPEVLVNGSYYNWDSVRKVFEE